MLGEIVPSQAIDSIDRTARTAVSTTFTTIIPDLFILSI